MKKKNFMVDDYMLERVLDKITEIIGIEYFDNTKILIDTNDQLPQDITWRNVVILMTCIINNDGKFYHRYF